MTDPLPPARYGWCAKDQLGYFWPQTHRNSREQCEEVLIKTSEALNYDYRPVFTIVRVRIEEAPHD
jgi:hypothetical protein